MHDGERRRKRRGAVRRRRHRGRARQDRPSPRRAARRRHTRRRRRHVPLARLAVQGRDRRKLARQQHQSRDVPCPGRRRRHQSRRLILRFPSTLLFLRGGSGSPTRVLGFYSTSPAGGLSPPKGDKKLASRALTAMPELPEAETILRGLKQRVLGRRIASIEVISPLVLKSPPDEFTEGAGGRWIKGVARKGKALAIELSGQDHALPRYLLLRLGMTGQLTVVPCESPLEPHTHVRLILDDGAHELRYRDVRRFGRLRCCTREELDRVWRSLGPDAREIPQAEFRHA